MRVDKCMFSEGRLLLQQRKYSRCNNRWRREPSMLQERQGSRGTMPRIPPSINYPAIVRFVCTRDRSGMIGFVVRPARDVMSRVLIARVASCATRARVSRPVTDCALAHPVRVRYSTLRTVKQDTYRKIRLPHI